MAIHNNERCRDGCSLAESHPRARSSRVCCKPIIGFVPQECKMNVMVCNNKRKVT